MQTVVEFLKDIYQDRKERNPSYSLASFARDLGTSKSILARVLSGERAVTTNFAMLVAASLDLSEAQTHSLLLNVVKTSSKNARIFKKVAEKVGEGVPGPADKEFLTTTVEMARWEVMAEWYHLAILNLTKVKGFRNDPEWMAERLGITLEEAVEAVEKLLMLGILVQEGESVRRGSQALYVKTQKSVEAVRKFHGQMLTKAEEELKKESDKDFKRRLINGITFPCDLDQVELIKEKIIKFQDEVFALVTGKEREEVYQMSVQFFPLTK